MLSLPKEGRANLPNGYRTSNCTRIGTDLSREGALHALDSRLENGAAFAGIEFGPARTALVL